MWLTNDILSLSYATLDFSTKSTVWKREGWTPKRAKAIQLAYRVGCISSINSLENVA